MIKYIKQLLAQRSSVRTELPNPPEYRDHNGELLSEPEHCAVMVRTMIHGLSVDEAISEVVAQRGEA